MKNLTKMTLISLATLTALSMGAWAECSADVDMGGHKISNVADPIRAKDVATKGYVDELLPDMREYLTEEGTLSKIDEVKDKLIKQTSRFIRDNDVDSSTYAVILDTVTGLLWTDHVYTVKKPWMLWAAYDACPNTHTIGSDTTNMCRDTGGDTATSYCENLELGGIYNWRLPTIKELIGIRKVFSESAYYSNFSNKPNVKYWTSENYPENHFRARTVSFDDNSELISASYSDSEFKYKSLSIRCISDQYNTEE